MPEPEVQIRPAEACADMPTLRSEIDRIDRALVQLLACRQRYIERAAQLKDHAGAVRDEARIADILGKVLREAERCALAPAIAEPVYRTLIECSIAFEAARFAAIRSRIS